MHISCAAWRRRMVLLLPQRTSAAVDRRKREAGRREGPRQLAANDLRDVPTAHCRRAKRILGTGFWSPGAAPADTSRSRRHGPAYTAAVTTKAEPHRRARRALQQHPRATIPHLASEPANESNARRHTCLRRRSAPLRAKKCGPEAPRAGRSGIRGRRRTFGDGERRTGCRAERDCCAADHDADTPHLSTVDA